MQDSPKAVRSIPYVSLAFLPSLKQNFIAYRSSKVSWRPDCIFEIHQLWQSGFSRVYSNCCCSCWFEPEIINICQSSHKMCSNNILNFLSLRQFEMPIRKNLETYRMHLVSSITWRKRWIHAFFKRVDIKGKEIVRPTYNRLTDSIFWTATIKANLFFFNT